MLKFIIAFFFWLILAPSSVYAYLDPGTGSYIVQLIIGVSIGASYFLATSWKRIASFVGGYFTNKGQSKQLSRKSEKSLSNKNNKKLTPSILREVMDFIKFFKNLTGKQKQIVFYAEHKGYYPYFEGLVERLTSKEKKEICYVSSDKNDPIFSSNNKRIIPLYLKTLLPLFMAYVDCKIFLITLTDLNKFHLKRSVNPVHYVYLFHSLVSIHMSYREGAFDHYDSILCAGPHHVEEIRAYEKMKGIKEKYLVNAGYYRLERINRAYKINAKNKNLKKQNTVLIAPSWGDKNVLKVCGIDIVDRLLQSGYKVIVRPHPEMTKRDPELIEEYHEKFDGNPNFSLEKSIATDDSLLNSDVLITDSSGISFEYAFGTERPVLFIDVPPKVKNPNYKKLKITPVELLSRSKIGKIVSTKKINTVVSEVNNLIRSRNKFKKNIIGLRKQYVFAFGRSTDNGIRYINKLLAKKS